MDFLDFEPQIIGTLNYIVTHNIWISQHHQTHRTFIIQIWYKATSTLKPNPWKLVIQEYGNVSLYHMCYLYLDLNIICIQEYIYIHNKPNHFHQIYSSMCKHHSNMCAIIWEYGGMEKKEWENREIDENSNCMELNMKIKKFH